MRKMLLAATVVLLSGCVGPVLNEMLETADDEIRNVAGAAPCSDTGSCAVVYVPEGCGGERISYSPDRVNQTRLDQAVTVAQFLNTVAVNNNYSEFVCVN